jgi:hypothetical protein
MQIRLITLALLISSILAFHVTMPKTDITYIPSNDGPIKVRVEGLTDVQMTVFSVEEAARLHVERYGNQPLEEYEIDHSQCWFNSCDLEWTIRLAKFEFIRVFSS